MKVLKCKERCALTLDGKKVVAYEHEEANSLLAAEGATVPAEKVKGLEGASKFFAKADNEEEAEDPAPSKRVVTDAEPVKIKAATVKK